MTNSPVLAAGRTLRQGLDTATGRVTMYRLVTILLSVTAVASIVLSLFGQLPFSPTDLLASVAIAIASTVVSSRILALVLRSRPHTESAVITGLILFFLFWPSTSAADLTVVALAGALATASKYLIAVRGRHILNPAAAGATLVAVLQFPSAVWWVASAALLPFTLVGAFLVLYRTRRMSMGLVFVAVSAAILGVRLTAGGQDLGGALATTFTSYPILFFVGFMLSEPLTMAPRRWQQLGIAALVGVLFTIPFTFGPVFLSFEFALVIGNVIAFAMGQRRGIRLEFASKRQLTPTAWEFSFRPERPVAFRAGQYMEMTLPHARADARGSRRIFSISSAPGSVLTFSMRMPRAGDTAQASSFKRALASLAPGTRIQATSVGGDFLLPGRAGTPVLMVAAGIGITPFLSQLVHDRTTGTGRDSVLVYSVSSLEELAFREELAPERVLLVAPEAPHDLPAAWRWIGSGPLTAERLAAEVSDLAGRTAYVSGAPAFVTALRAALRRAGVRRVATDYFAGY
ncbi:MAG: oxidoreductase [Burkholderiaceae bacterium]|nr:oxidoreductase [Microbacteriaceae bacterium]